MLIEGAVLPEIGAALEVTSVTLADPKRDEVLVRMVASGVCHSDMSIIQGYWGLPAPLVLGHEGAGIIEGVGPGVDPGRIGEKVVLTFAPACGTCRFCLAGRANMCEVATDAMNSGLLCDGTSRLSWKHGPLYHLSCVSSFATHAVVPANAAITVDDDVDLSLACLFGCGVTTGLLSVTKRANVRPGDSVAVFGCGGVGLSVVQGARLISAHPVIAVDPIASKRAMASKFGATHTLDPTEIDVVAEIHNITGHGVEFAFEAVGSADLVRQAFDATSRGGTTVMVGQTPMGVDACLPDYELSQYEYTILGSNLGGASPALDFPKLTRLLTAGKIDLASLVTHRFGLRDVNEALAVMLSGDAGRVVVEFP
jgi:S-(hydroxymethyl)glutathione dehydrogenase/alcohol dehydrogenase